MLNALHIGDRGARSATLRRVLAASLVNPICRLCLLGSMFVAAGHAAALAQSGNDTMAHSENFDSGLAVGWWADAGWSVESSEGGFAYRGDGSGHAHTSYGDRQWGDALLRLRFRLNGDLAHVSYRDGVAGRYFLRIDSSAVVLNKQYYPDTFLDNLASGPGVTFGVWHTLEIDGTGGSLAVRIDDGEVLSYEDPEALSAGGVSLESFGAEFWVDDIEVYVPASEVPPEAPTGLTWVRTGGPLGGLGYDIRIHPLEPNLLFVTDAFAGVFRSIDGGQSWSPANSGITTRTGTSGDAIPIFCLTIDPNDPNIIWCGTSGVRGIYKSIDRGESWIETDDGVVEDSGITFRGFTVEPGNSDVVYAAAELSSWVWSEDPLTGREFDLTQGVVYRTTNGGAGWTAVWRGDNLARYVWIDPADTDILYISTGIFDREAANSDPQAADRAAGAGGVGVVKSIDGGVTWNEINNGLNNLYVGSLFMHPENPSILIAGTGNNQYYDDAGVYLTVDGGASWQQTLADVNINAVEFATADVDIAYAGSAESIYRSADGGQTWQPVTTGPGWGPPGVRAGFPIDFQIDPADPDRLFVNNYGGGNFLSEDAGQNWSEASRGYTGAQVRDIAADPEAAGRVFAAARSGLFKTLDGGEQWAGRSFHPAAVLEWYAVAIDPHDSRHILAASNWDGILVESRDGGSSWEVVGPSLDPGVSWRAITFAAAEPATIYAGTSAFFSAGTFDETLPAAGVYISQNGGESWKEANDLTSENANVTALAIDPGDLSTVYAATGNSGLLKTTDGGGSWTVINQGLPASPSALAVAVHPLESDRVFTGLSGAGLYRSEDGGASWEQSGFGMSPQATVADIVFHPTDVQILYAADLLSGVYLSEDGGASWAQLPDGLRTRAVNALAISGDGQHLYAATEGEGVFRLDLFGEPPPEAEEPGDDDADGNDNDNDNTNVNANGNNNDNADTNANANDNDNDNADTNENADSADNGNQNGDGDDNGDSNDNANGDDHPDGDEPPGGGGGVCGPGAASAALASLLLLLMTVRICRERRKS